MIQMMSFSEKDNKALLKVDSNELKLQKKEEKKQQERVKEFYREERKKKLKNLSSINPFVRAFILPKV